MNSPCRVPTRSQSSARLLRRSASTTAFYNSLTGSPFMTLEGPTNASFMANHSSHQVIWILSQCRSAGGPPVLQVNTGNPRTEQLFCGKHRTNTERARRGAPCADAQSFPTSESSSQQLQVFPCLLSSILDFCSILLRLYRNWHSIVLLSTRYRNPAILGPVLSHDPISRSPAYTYSSILAIALFPSPSPPSPPSSTASPASHPWTSPLQLPRRLLETCKSS